MYTTVHLPVDLPASIEAALEEAGFSGTEVVVLRHMVGEDAVTLRQLASRSGKSTGVLDLAMKKLLKKRIITKETINEVPRYVLHSLESVIALIDKDAKDKQEVIIRKNKDMRSYIQTLIHEKHRPHLEHYEGEEGIQKAYMALLNIKGEHMQYGPTLWKAEDDPLRDFRVQYFRERRSRGAFARVITHNNPLGRRSRSRDPFEYRKTLLLDPEDFPFEVEKIIVGDVVATFDLMKNKAFFLTSKEVADHERKIFGGMWRQAMAYDKRVGVEEIAQDSVNKKQDVPFSTRTLSSLRDFFVSRRSLVAFGVCALLAGLVTFGLYKQTEHLNLLRVQSMVKAVAATSATQFNADDINEIHVFDDYKKPEYKKLIYLLNDIRRQNEGVAYAYILRPTGEPYVFEFVADADVGDPTIKADYNKDGVIDDADEPSYPGMRYDDGDTTQPVSGMVYEPTAYSPATDQWGTVVAAWAPIRDRNGKEVAIIGIDVFADRVEHLTRNSFAPIYYFFGFFLLFVLLRLAAFNRSLFKELCDLLKMKKVVIVFTAAGLAALAVTFGLYRYNVNLALERIRERITSIAATGALQFTAREMDELRTLNDVQKPIYADIVRRLGAIREQNGEIAYVYILRPTDNQNTYEFIADADSADPYAKIDTNLDGLVDEADALGYPGRPYDVSQMEALESIPTQPVSNSKTYTDQWGTFITGYAPIKNASGATVALLAVDMWGGKVYEWSARTFAPVVIFLIFFGAFLLFRFPALRGSLIYDLLGVFKSRKVLLIIGFTLMGIYWVGFGFYLYAIHNAKRETGERLMAIAATAAPMINADDLKNLHTYEDMKTEEYQRVFKQLNDIRKRNPDLTYIYTMRPGIAPGIWEFVVDADSNYFLPSDEIDWSKDGVIDDADENVWPGVQYDMYPLDECENEGMKKPTYMSEIIPDHWGSTLTACAPIFDKNGISVAQLNVSLYIDNIDRDSRATFLKFAFLLIFIICTFAIMCLNGKFKQLNHSALKR